MTEQKSGLFRNWWADALRTSSARHARIVSTDFGVKETLGLSPEQDKLFQQYFAAYFIQQEMAEIAYLGHRPETELMRQFTLLRAFPDLIDTMNNIADIVAVEFFTQAASTAGIINADAQDIIKEFVIERIANESVSSNIDWDAAQTKTELNEAATEVLKKVGSPQAIRVAANLISSVYTENRKGDRQTLEPKLRQTISRIKIKGE